MFSVLLTRQRCGSVHWIEKLACWRRSHSAGGYSQWKPEILIWMTMYNDVWRTNRNSHSNIDNEIHRHNYGKYHYLNMDWLNIHRYRADKRVLYMMLNIDIQNHWSIETKYIWFGRDPFRNYFVDACAVTMTRLWETMIYCFRTSRPSPSIRTVASIGTQFINTSNWIQRSSINEEV